MQKNKGQSEAQQASTLWNLQQYLIPEQRLSRKQVDAKLDSYTKKLHDIHPLAMRIQYNQGLNFKPQLAQLLDLHTYNTGDPFQKGISKTHTKQIECAVVRYYAKLWNFAMRNLEIDSQGSRQAQPDDAYWGYVLSMGSTEGNLTSFWMGRDYVEGKYLAIDKEKYHPTSKKAKHVPYLQHEHQHLKPTVYFTSQAAHYSIFKAGVVVNVPSFGEYGDEHYLFAEIEGIKAKGEPFPSHVPVYSDLDGRVDVQKLVKLVSFFAERRHGIMINLNYGTTLSGAYDQLHRIIPALRDIFEKNHLNQIRRELIDPESNTPVVDIRKGYWIHVDGAQGGSFLPYFKRYVEKNLVTQKCPDPFVDTFIMKDGTVKSYHLSDIPPLDCTLYPQISSVVTSGYGFPKAPWPCGVYITRHKYQLYLPSTAMYTGSPDSTLSGSRNALSPVLYWYYLSSHPETQIEKQAYENLIVAKHAQHCIRDIITQKNSRQTSPKSLMISRAPLSTSLIFSRTNADITSTYSLEQQDIKGEHVDHLFVMSHLHAQPDILKSLFEDLKREGAFISEEKKEKQGGQSSEKDKVGNDKEGTNSSQVEPKV